MKIIFIGDNRTRLNWGCRATSIALKEMISINNEIIYTIYGDLTLQYSFKTRYNSLNTLIKIIDFLYTRNKIINSFINFIGFGDFISQNINTTLQKFQKISKNVNIYNTINNKIKEADAIIINGEGSFIFSKPHRRDTIFYLMLLKKAQLENKKTYCLNTMFSDCPKTGRNIPVFNASIEILKKCDTITIRDLESYRTIKKHISNTNIHFIPDALFSWKKYESNISIFRNPNTIIPFPENENYWNKFNFSTPYICISGSSSALWDEKNAIICYENLINEIKKFEIKIYIIPTCSSDNFLVKVAEKTNTQIIPANINILIGMSILANAKILISGRWHPSILASLGGTPCIMLGSNSHKTKSFLELFEYDKPIEYNSIPSKEDIKNIILDITNILKNEDFSIRNRIISNVKKFEIETLKHINFDTI